MTKTQDLLCDLEDRLFCVQMEANVAIKDIEAIKADDSICSIASDLHAFFYFLKGVEIASSHIRFKIMDMFEGEQEKISLQAPGGNS